VAGLRHAARVRSEQATLSGAAKAAGPNRGNVKPRIFVGSSGEAIDVCRAIQQELERDFDVTPWDQDVFRLTYDTLDSLLAALDSSDAGIFVLREDDLTESRGQSSPTVRDNVIFELGMFIGRLGRDRTFMLSPHGSNIRLPSDLMGITTAHYDIDRFEREPRAAVGPACTQIRQLLRSIQLRIPPEPAFQARLDRAMSRMSKDLEDLLADYSAGQNDTESFAEWPGAISVQLARTSMCVEVGRIQDYQSVDTRAAIALPANEYFDDECITDANSSLGAFVQHHFKDTVPNFVRQVGEELSRAPSQRVPRAEHRIERATALGR
jgi:predicted nucleotide-binding protein